MAETWPETFDVWFAQYHEKATKVIENRLQYYPALRAFAYQTASLGIERCRDIGQYLQQYPDYFLDRSFYLWLCTVGYREALRLVLTHEPIEAALETLERPAVEMKRLLQWCYIDQLTEEEVARMLDINTTAPPRFQGDADARRRILTAYERLCEAISRRFPAAELVKSGPYRDVSVVFPLPPAIPRITYWSSLKERK